jgi:glycosyltransferase involved in cell wall biosynthesis
VVATPRVSVIVPLYNLGRYVAAAIESVLTQTLPPTAVEIVVVDDGSTDGGGDVARRYEPRVRVLRQENRGLSAARNAGIRASRAPLLAFLDADDQFLPDKLSAQLAVFDAQPDVGLVYTGVRHVDESGALLPQRGWARDEGDVFPRLVLGNLIHPLVALVRRAPVERAGGFDETLTSVEDWDLWLRISRPGLRWAVVDRALADYRVRADAMHQNAGRMIANCLRVLDKVFADPTLPASVVALKPLAYHRAYLTAACDHYRSGDLVGGARWFQAAALARPAFLTEPRSLALFCRWLLPTGFQAGPVVIAELPRLSATLRDALHQLFATPDLAEPVARLRWRARLTYALALWPLVRKRARALLGRQQLATLGAPLREHAAGR